MLIGLILLPVLTALLIAALPDRHPAGKNTAHFLTGLATVTGFAWTLHYLQTFLIQPAFKITQTIPWIILENRSFDLIWRLDGLSLFFVISTGLVFTVLYFLQFPKVQNQKVFNMAFLFLPTLVLFFTGMLSVYTDRYLPITDLASNIIIFIIVNCIYRVNSLFWKTNPDLNTNIS
jgi:NADH:ubiquinone oxidoreductase subunit 4 (subunit M)